MNIIDKIALELNLDSTYISRIASRSMFYYKDFAIPKKNGGRRFISQPSPELKTLQYWVLNRIFKKLPISNAAYAYKKGDSIKKHASLHCKSKFIFHTDIQSFFPSVHSSHLESILRANKDIFDELDLDLDNSIEDINNICFRADCLCIGAVSSPAISNIVMRSFDDTINSYCKKHNYIYSRYADDIYISSNSFIDKEIVNIINAELSKMKLKINYTKTKFYSPKYRRKVTGLILTNESKVSIGTQQRNKIKKMIYNKLIHGVGNPDQILGYLSFLKDIEPNTYNNLIIKYSKYCNEDIITALSE